MLVGNRSLAINFQTRQTKKRHDVFMDCRLENKATYPLVNTVNSI